MVAADIALLYPDGFALKVQQPASFFIQGHPCRQSQFLFCRYIIRR